MGSKHTVLRAEGFYCPSCVSKIEKQVGGLKGVSNVVSNVKVHFASSRIEVDHDENLVPVEDLVATVKKVGYTAKASPF